MPKFTTPVTYQNHSAPTLQTRQAGAVLIGRCEGDEDSELFLQDVTGGGSMGMVPKQTLIATF